MRQNDRGNTRHLQAEVEMYYSVNQHLQPRKAKVQGKASEAWRNTATSYATFHFYRCRSRFRIKTPLTCPFFRVLAARGFPYIQTDRQGAQRREAHRRPERAISPLHCPLQQDLPSSTLWSFRLCCAIGRHRKSTRKNSEGDRMSWWGDLAFTLDDAIAIVDRCRNSCTKR